MLSGSATEEDSLGPFPGFDTNEEQDSLYCQYGPFPGDGFVFENDVVQHGYVENRKNGNPPSHDGPEEELVPPDIIHPLGEVLLGFGLHAKE